MRSISSGHDAHSPCHGGALYLPAQYVAAALRQLLAVVEHIVMVVRGQNDGRRIYRSGKASAARLVTSRLYETLVIMA